MRILINKFSSQVFIISLSLGFMLACSTTPNLPYQGRGYPDNFSQVVLNNRLLAFELSKLPELQDGISEEESKALKIIGKYYKEKPEAFDSAFNKMYMIGLPEVRKFCSPLQALFWLAEDGELQKNMGLVHNYTLKALLDKSWGFEASIKISEDQITKIVNGIKNKNMKEDYLARRKRLSTPMYLKVINAAYTKNKFAFTKEARKIIEDVKDTRWDNFYVVTKRLNAPELIDYYERKRFNYAHWKSLPKPPISPHYVFKYNIGECVSITGFTVFCLRKAGYRAREIRVAGHNADYHAITLFEMNGKKFVMDNGLNTPVGIHPYVKNELKK